MQRKENNKCKEIKNGKGYSRSSISIDTIYVNQSHKELDSSQNHHELV